jgi:uncharacterized protein (DUF302 family)
MTMEVAKTISLATRQTATRTVHLDVTAVEARDRLMHALEQAGFSVLAEIDLADLLRRRADRELEPNFIIEVCRPELAIRALAVSSDASLLMPCKLAVWKEGRGATVGMLSPRRLGHLLGHEHLDSVAANAEERLERVLEAISVDVPRTEHRPRPIADVRFALGQAERDVLIAAIRSRMHALLAESAGTEKHELQHALAGDLDQLEGILRKLGAPS